MMAAMMGVMMRTMIRRSLRSLGLAALVSAAMAAGVLAKPVRFEPPADSSTLKQSPAPGYAKTEALCATCHSRDYITTQPPHKGKDFWTAEVTKMVNVYGAPIPETERAAIADYLAATY
jgi:mono/diheme cytochrome c family protein